MKIQALIKTAEAPVKRISKTTGDEYTSQDVLLEMQEGETLHRFRYNLHGAQLESFGGAAQVGQVMEAQMRIDTNIRNGYVFNDIRLTNVKRIP